MSTSVNGVIFKVNGATYTVYGSAEFYGPYAECDGATIEELSPESNDPEVLSEAQEAIIYAAYDKYRNELDAREDYRNQCYDDHECDDYPEDDHQVGPDYWWDEDGEPRCG